MSVMPVPCSLWWIISIVFFGIKNSHQISGKYSLHEHVNLNQLKHIIGDSHLGLTTVYPKQTKISENVTLNGHYLHIEVPDFQQNFSAKLFSTPKLFSNEFRIYESLANGSVALDLHENEDCYFYGESMAISLCDGVRGILHSNEENEYFIIHPFPKKFHNQTTHHTRPHIIVRKNSTVLHADNELMSLKAARIKRNAYLTKDPKESLAIGAPVFIETAVFVDKDLFEHMKINYPTDTDREIIRFVLAMINAVQLLYHDPSLGRPVNFLLKRLEILKEEVTGLIRPPDIDRFLSNFCNWQRIKNPYSDKDPQHWDHALILTGLDLYVRGKHGKISNQVVGLAPVSGMCTITSSCTVNEGRHFESVYVVAHEIGHNLGMRHDGPMADNDCDPTSYIMSPTLGSGKITWSPCSKRYFQNFLDTSQSVCLLDHGSSFGQFDHSAEGILPGERFDSDQQCMLKYGKGSQHSSQQPLDDVCRDLHCERDRYTWTSHPALEGTMCGHNMWCRGGRCISRTLKTLKSSSVNEISSNDLLYSEQINGDWSQWRTHGECASGCLFGEGGRLHKGSTGILVATRLCNSPKKITATTNVTCDGPKMQYQACDAKQCLNVPRLTVKEFAHQVCKRAKHVDPNLTGIGFQKISSDAEEACMVWCQKYSGKPINRGWTFPDGTICQKRRNRFGKWSYCINGRCEEFICDVEGDLLFAQNPDMCPLQNHYDNNNNNINNWDTELRLRSEANVVKWKSVSGCHFNCITPGSGIRVVVAKETDERTTIQLCETEKFACNQIKTISEYASTVCEGYKDKVRQLSGLGMQITPTIEDPDRPCRIACQDEKISHRFYVVNGEEGWFPFGTDCSIGSTAKRICISGKCLEFGPDNTPVLDNEYHLPLFSRGQEIIKKSQKTIGL